MSNSNQEQLSSSTELDWLLDGIQVKGTLVKPKDGEPFPAVVMVAGSGPTDRNWESPLLPGQNGSAPLLADSLATEGIASLRYDKRVTGPHGLENARALIGKLSMQSHVEELAGGIKTLADRSDIRKEKIFGLGNSEGTLHVLNYQLNNPAINLAGLILVGPPGRAVGDVARTQIAEQAAAVPDGDKYMALYDESIKHFLAGEEVTPDPALPEGVQQVLLALNNPANLPMSRELWNAEAATLLKQIDVPVLVIIGKKDIQIDWQVEGGILQEAAADNENVTFIFPENTNHILKYEPRPRTELTMGDVLAGYNAPGGYLDPEAVAAIGKWLHEHI
jgi:pimeloyl-ACP methyl ester carboxylesterase